MWVLSVLSLNDCSRGSGKSAAFVIFTGSSSDAAGFEDAPPSVSSSPRACFLRESLSRNARWSSSFQIAAQPVTKVFNMISVEQLCKPTNRRNNCHEKLSQNSPKARLGKGTAAAAVSWDVPAMTLSKGLKSRWCGVSDRVLSPVSQLLLEECLFIQSSGRLRFLWTKILVGLANGLLMMSVKPQSYTNGPSVSLPKDQLKCVFAECKIIRQI